MTTPNAELAYKVLDHIDAHPELWQQYLYIGRAECGTVACFAGWTVLLSGGKPRHWSGRSNAVTDEVIFDGKEENVSYRAQLLLDADRRVREGEVDEEDLFDGQNTREDLGRLVAEIFGPRPCPNCPPGYDCERGNYATTEPTP